MVADVLGIVGGIDRAARMDVLHSFQLSHAYLVFMFHAFFGSAVFSLLFFEFRQFVGFQI